MSSEREKLLKDFYNVIISLDTIDDCDILFSDLLTPKELENITQRIKAAKLLKEGKTYVEIVKETGISNTTLSRISKSLKYGEGYKKFI